MPDLPARQNSSGPENLRFAVSFLKPSHQRNRGKPSVVLRGTTAEYIHVRLSLWGVGERLAFAHAAASAARAVRVSIMIPTTWWRSKGQKVLLFLAVYLLEGGELTPAKMAIFYHACVNVWVHKRACQRMCQYHRPPI
jgi:hypothetical protein